MATKRTIETDKTKKTTKAEVAPQVEQTEAAAARSRLLAGRLASGLPALIPASSKTAARRRPFRAR
jgi:hypothetical protein